MTTSPTPGTTAPDESRRAQDLIEVWLAMDPEAQNERLARLIAATIHSGDGTALETFARGGELDAATALEELNDVRVPLEREPWVDALGRFILASAGELS